MASNHPSAIYPQGALPGALSKKAETASIKERLSRIFSSRGVTKSTPPQNDVAAATGAQSDMKSVVASGSSGTNNLASPRSAVAKPAHHPRKASANLDGGKDTPMRRFVVRPELQGGHEHHLESNRRKQRSAGMWRNLLSTMQEQATENNMLLGLAPDNPIQQEKEQLLVEKIGGPKKSATLVEKYGKCQEVIGRGSFGIVRISHKRIENGAGEELYAVKEFRRRPEETENRHSKRLTAEFWISRELRHPNVIRTLDLLKDAQGVYFEVMEFCAGGDLYTLVRSAGRLEEQEADCFFKQMMRGLEYIHEMGVAHRDLKPENLLLTSHGGLKISDFGNSECIRMAWENDVHMVSGLCGSGPYIAPEEYINKEFDGRAVDIWACGVIYMAMRTGSHLWHVANKDQDEFYTRYLERRRREEGFGPIESLRQAHCRNIIYCILDPNSSRRITASQVLRSEWGREIALCQAGQSPGT
ncbi:kinase domain-containing protein [Dactylonectria macrodidyma]|uniref:non-specific serine/threonine protein kinase n=1 Tax=Dactylonectria macrodidyma TaxID=307937 RepID=A0A9P9IIC4_9HYPO|nr:kinase domain-containing protein [Dactylonectria macrodidyma]